MYFLRLGGGRAEAWNRITAPFIRNFRGLVNLTGFDGVMTTSVSSTVFRSCLLLHFILFFFLRRALFVFCQRFIIVNLTGRGMFAYKRGDHRLRFGGCFLTYWGIFSLARSI